MNKEIADLCALAIVLGLLTIFQSIMWVMYNRRKGEKENG